MLRDLLPRVQASGATRCHTAQECDGRRALPTRLYQPRDIRTRLTGTRCLCACVQEPKKVSAKVGRLLRRLQAHGLIAKNTAHAPLARHKLRPQRGGLALCVRVYRFPYACATAGRPELLRKRQRSHCIRVYVPDSTGLSAHCPTNDSRHPAQLALYQLPPWPPVPPRLPSMPPSHVLNGTPAEFSR